MVDETDRATFYAPQNWLVVFYPESLFRWVNWLVPGRFKHVSLITFVPQANAWLFYSVEPTRGPVELWPGDRKGSLRFAEVTAGATVVKFPNAVQRSSWLRAGWWCVPAAKHALGVRSGALWPDQLYRYLMANGGEIVKAPHVAQDSTAGPGHRRGAEACR